jgi:phage regulator Rha-like protein
MFELSKKEYQSLRSQNVTLKRGQHSKYLPFVFTEQGVAMLSSVLKSEKAVQVNIQIMRAFIMMRKISISNDQLNQKIIAQERKYDRSDFKSFSMRLSN